MNAVQHEIVNGYRQAFDARLAQKASGQGPGPDLRRRSMDQFAVRGFDTRGREDWKYGDIKPMASNVFRPVEGGEDTTARYADLISPHTSRYLVFLNGLYRPALSKPGGLPPGVSLRPLASAGTLSALGTVTDTSDAAFTLLNGAFWSDGLVLELAEGMTMDRPLELFFVTDSAADAGLVAPRNLIVAGRDSRAEIIEYHVGPGDAASLDSLLNVPLTEVICAEGAEIRHTKILRENEKAMHAGATHVRQSAGSRYLSREVVMGGGPARRELHVDLAGSGAICDIGALYMGAGDRRLDMRTRVRHSAPGCETHELYKGILGGRATAVFDGLIHVARDAQQTSAHQTNRNLLISDTAVAYSIPRLEIYADDVKCSHGSTTGQIDEDQLFYLRSRGFDRRAARVILAGAFAGEILDDLDPPTLRDDLIAEAAARIGGGDTSGGPA